MADWPPNPNQSSNQNPQQNQQYQPQQAPAGREWQIIEKTMLASIEEQRKARRWNLIFKGLTFAYLLFLLLALGRGCSQVPTSPGSSSEHIAVIDVEGVIGGGKNGVESGRINHALKEAFESSTSKAVVLNINSPGGSPVASDQIWQRMRQLKKDNPEKKLYAYIGDMGASGAYYIASAADEIWVNKSSLVGSIGVIMPNYDVEGLAKKLGVKDRTMTAGDHKDILSMTQPIDEFEKQHVQGVLDNVHKHFIDAVKTGRGAKLKDPEGNRLFSGLFWSGEQAINLGLADKAGGIRDIGESLKVDEFVSYTPVDPLQELLGGLGVKLGEGIGNVMGDKLLSQINSEQAEPKLQ